MMKRLCVGIAAAVSAGLITLAPTASAASMATNTRTQPVSVAPQPGAHSCIDRSIYLDSSWYDWQLVLGNDVLKDRQIDLTNGTYQWEDCLSYAGTGMYLHTSTLSLPGHPQAYLDVNFGLVSTSDPTPDVYWGSQLVPVLHA